jgi:hypothetical protein
LARVVDEGVEVISVPGKAKVWSSESFRSLWSGSALLVQRHTPETDVMSGSSQRFGTVAVVAGGALVILGIALIARTLAKPSSGAPPVQV